MNPIKQLINFFKLRRKYKNKLVSFSPTCTIDSDSNFEGANKLGSFVRFSGEIGFGSYINSHSTMTRVKIGRFCSIAQNVHMIGSTHAMQAPFVTTCPAFFSIAKQNGMTFVKENKFEEMRYADNEGHTAVLGNDVWVGYGVSILGGVKLGDGSVVLSNATVTKDVPPYAIVGGVPAKILKYRYDEETIEKLLRIKWWDKDVSWLKEHAEEFSDLDTFLQKHS